MERNEDVIIEKIDRTLIQKDERRKFDRKEWEIWEVEFFRC
jgi:hypothetical protein